MNKWQGKFSELFGIDVRSLALFRMGLALVILGDLYVRFQDLQAHYTDAGVLPRAVLTEELEYPWTISLHMLYGAWQFEFVLFNLAALFALGLLLGYRTKIATALSWIFLVSLQARNPIILQGGDVVLRLLLFWSMFLPLGSCWAMQKTPVTTKQIVSGGTIGLLLQVCFIYWFAALLKTDESWTTDGTAVWLSLNIEQYTTPLGMYLLQFPDLLKLATFATLYLEAFGPFFAFSPMWTGPLRLATALVFIVFHLFGLNLTMELALFPYVCSVAWLVFIPGCAWDFLAERFPRTLRNESPSSASSLQYSWKAGLLSNILAITCIVYIFFWNVITLGIKVPFWSDNVDIPGFVLQIDQYWNMFSPFPLKEDGWYVIPARLKNGSQVDLYTHGKPVSWEKPPLVSAVYPNDRWRSLMMNLLIDENGFIYTDHYARYLCREWNRKHNSEEQLVDFDIFFMLKRATVDDPHPTPMKTHIWHHVCFRGVHTFAHEPGQGNEVNRRAAVGAEETQRFIL